jgi:hypothetical protein
MKRRDLLTGGLVLAVSALCIRPAFAQDAARNPVALIIAAPANRSPGMQKLLRRDLARLYGDVITGDQISFVNASSLQVMATFTVPGNLGDTENERDDALLDLFAPLNAFVSRTDSTVPVDNVHMPALLREIGRNILPTFTGHAANVVIIGSMQWEEKEEADWSFHDHMPSDFFLSQSGGSFGLAGEETILNGARVSILYSDKPDAFAWEGFRQMALAWWRKSIRGRGGAVGEIAPYGQGSYPRFFATTEDATPAPIDTAAKMVLYAPGMVTVPVKRIGDKPLPSKKDSHDAHVDNRIHRRHGYHKNPAGPAGRAGQHNSGGGVVAG